MKKTHYLCIDDMPDAVQVATERLNAAKRGLHIDVQPPKEFKSQMAELVRRRKKKELDGVILDLRLNDFSSPGAPAVEYKAQNLASELRNRMAEGKVHDFPIVLWSISQKFAKSYDKDLTSHDLFDLVVDKEELNDADKIVTRANQLVSLAAGFEVVATQPRGRTFWRALLKTPEGTIIDPRIGQSLETSAKKSPTHVIARYVLKSIVEVPGPLIDEPMLCARLGVEEGSIKGSRLLKELNRLAVYEGPFSEAWPRWWWSTVEKWWRGLDANLPSILSLTAVKRVAQLSKSGYKKLKPAQPIDEGYSTRFTTICQHLKKPLDPLDGFMLNAAGLEPWQDRQYVCRDVALRPGFHHFNGQLDSFEIERLKEARKAAKR